MPNLITYLRALIKLGYRTVGNSCKVQVVHKRIVRPFVHCMLCCGMSIDLQFGIQHQTWSVCLDSYPHSAHCGSVLDPESGRALGLLHGGQCLHSGLPLDHILCRNEIFLVSLKSSRSIDVCTHK